MVKIGNFFFHYRNGLFPLVYLLLFVPSRPILPDYRIALAFGLLTASLGQLVRAVTIGLEYIIRGGRNRQVYAKKLVQGGIFAHCRNPLYLGNYLILCGVGFASNSWLFLSAAMPFFTFAYWAIIAAEENYLGNKFGAEFDEYCARVNRIVPRLKGLTRTVSDAAFNWRKLISSEYGSAFIWTAAILLVTLKNVWDLGQYSHSSLFVLGLWAGLFLDCLVFGAVRYLKKNGTLDDRKKAIAPETPPEFVPESASFSRRR